MDPFRLALAQVNATVGDLESNVQKILDGLNRARDLGADLVAFPELAIPGYPPEDLLLMPSFLKANRASLERVAAASRGITALVGFVDSDGRDIYNAAAIVHDGRVAAVYHKTHLPNYAVFDEYRYFQAGRRPVVFTLRGTAVGVNICEDIWYPAGPTEVQALAGAQLVVNISASPYYVGKGRARERMLATRAADNVVFVAMCNLVGGQDELVFDGGSMMIDARGELIARARPFEEDLLVADLDLPSVFRQRLHDPRQRQERPGGADEVEWVELAPSLSNPRPPLPSLQSREGKGAGGSGGAGPASPEAEVYQALVLATRDYVRKNGFQKVVIALSGGIDSALTAAIAADALGPENVTGVAMPARYSSPISREDAEALATNLGIHFTTIPIDGTFQAYLDMLAGTFADVPPDVTEENVQARIRGNVLMALSNKFGWLVLTTGNKSELAVGYCTLYGDMVGGYAVLKDVFKTRVYQLARYRNTLGPAIPERTIDRPPTAELRPDQRDEDSLGPYATLDPILEAYVEEDCSLEEIVARGHDEAVVRRILRMVDGAEYKRRQGVPGIKITKRAFGKDRRLPVTNQYRQ
jgi:NAD+ synthase (glutamine-hydrolysing)